MPLTMKAVPSRRMLAVVGVVIFSFSLNLLGINFGLPYLFHPDEGALVMPAANILRTGNPRPIRLDYGSAYIYSLTALYVPYYLYGFWRGDFTSPADIPVYPDYHYVGRYPVPDLFLIGRIFTAVFGSLMVLVVYVTGRKLVSHRAGLWAAFLLAITPEVVMNAHFARTDVPMACLVTVAVYCMLNVYRRGHWHDYLWAGLWAGLAASTKYPAGLVLGGLVGAHLLREGHVAACLDKRLWLGAGAAAGGFLLGTPYALLEPRYFGAWLKYVFFAYSNGSGSGGPLTSGLAAVYYVKELFWSPSGLLAVLGLAGMGWLLRRDWRQGIVFILFPALYFVLIAVQTTRYTRILVPLLPFLALGAGIILDRMVGNVTSRPFVAPLRLTLISACLMMLVVFYPLLASVKFGLLLSGPDVRTIALDWCQAHIRPEDKVMSDPMGPPLTDVSRHVSLTWNYVEHDATWYIDQHFDYIVMSEGLATANQNLSLRDAEQYKKLMNRFTLVKSFEGAMLGVEGDRILVYRVIP